MLSIMSWESWETPEWPIIDALEFEKKNQVGDKDDRIC